MSYTDYLSKEGCIVHKDKTIRCAYKSACVFDTVICPTEFTAAVKAEKITAQEGRTVFIGGVSNTLPADGQWHGIAVSTERLCGIIRNNRSLYVMGGEKLPKVCAFAASCGLSGLEEMCGIPGSIGGGVINNCGCYGKEICELVSYVDVASSGRVDRVQGKDIKWDYRSSSLKGKGMIVGVMLDLEYSSCKKVKLNNDIWTQQRASTQPRLPSLGCTFKRVNGTSAGMYIDKAGLKGLSEGGAQVSQVHAGFIVNTGDGTARDYITLAEKVKRILHDTAGIDLQYEIEILDN